MLNEKLTFGASNKWQLKVMQECIAFMLFGGYVCRIATMFELDLSFTPMFAIVHAGGRR
jgi:hypothetical protein